MNFLAHLYLSRNDDALQVGNFIGDYVKGRAHEQFPHRIRSGILLHRHIDRFTDRHSVVRVAQERFKPGLGRYAAVVLDVVYDHLLASRWPFYSQQALFDFSAQCYTNLENHLHILPTEVKNFLPHMKASNRLLSYATQTGLAEALRLMARYTSLPEQSDFVLEVLQRDEEEMQQEFSAFFHELRQYVDTMDLAAL